MSTIGDASVGLGACPRGGAVVVVLRGRPTDTRLHRLCAEVQRRLDAGAPAVVCDLAALAAPDLGAVEALARLRLVAARGGRPLALRHASPTLVGLVALVGLGDLLAVSAPPGCPPRRGLPPPGWFREPGWFRDPGWSSGVQVRRQPEQREQVGGVEERGDPGDAAV